MRGASAAEKAKAVAAKEFLSSLVLERCVSLSDVSLEKYGRLLATVRVRGRNVNRMLLESGHAVPYDGGTKPRFDAVETV